MYYACMELFLMIGLMCGAGDAVKQTSHFLYVFLGREMLVLLVNFEKRHSPIHSWLSQTGTVSFAVGHDKHFRKKCLPLPPLGWMQAFHSVIENCLYGEPVNPVG
jgi:hypothetical protein